MTTNAASDHTAPARAVAVDPDGESGPGLGLTAERELCGLVGRLARRIDEHVRTRGVDLDLTGPQAVALRELTGPMTMRQLAERMSCEPSNVTFVIDRLEKQGVVVREPHPHDRRAKILVLTEQGNELRERLIAVLSQGSPLGSLTADEQRTLHALLDRAVRPDAG